MLWAGASQCAFGKMRLRVCLGFKLAPAGAAFSAQQGVVSAV